jgi:uncharacterized phage-associated protein
MTGDSLGFSALDIAKWFINATDRGAGDDITHLKVQKLLYYAQGWALAYLRKPLFSEDLEAWAHGPVAPSIYSHFRGYSFNSLPEQKITRKISGDVAQLLDAVNEKYGIYTAKRLERMTHKETPWKNARGELPPEVRCNNAISKKDMKKFFSTLKS